MSMIRFNHVLLLVGILLGAVPGTGAQSTPGNIAAITGQNLLEVSPAGVVSTIAFLPAGHTPLGICPSVDNRGIALLTRTGTSSIFTAYVLEVKNSVVRTLSWITAPGNPIVPFMQGGIVPDQRGDYIISPYMGILRVDGVSGSITTINPALATGLCDNLTPGGWLSFYTNTVYRFNRGGRQSTVIYLNIMNSHGHGSLTTDTSTGNAFLANVKLYAIDVGQGKFTTLASGPPLSYVFSVDIDPRDRSLIVGDSSGIYRCDRQGGVVSTFARFNTGTVGVTVIGSNHVSGFGSVSPGTKYHHFVSFPRYPSHFYDLAASFGTLPGIRIPSGTIPLNPDTLFWLSRFAPHIFQNYRGQLDSAGRAHPALAIPAAPIKGVRIFIAGIAYDARGVVKAISEPMGLTFE